MKENIKLFLSGFFGFFVGIAVVTALTVDMSIPSLRAYLKTLFLTSDGTPSGTTNIVIDGNDGSITMQGDLNIKQGALKNDTVLSEDIVNGTIKAEDIGVGQIVNTHLAPNSVTSDKIANGTITAADLGANIDVSSDTDGKNIRVDYARTAGEVISTVDKASKIVAPDNTVVGEGVNTYLKTSQGISFGGANRGGHLNIDGAFYRYNGQVYLTVDDYFYIRDTDGSIISRIYQYGGNTYFQMQDGKSLYIRDLGGANIARFGPDGGLTIYSGLQNWTIFGECAYVRTDRGPRVEYGGDGRISAGNNPDKDFALKLAGSMVALRSMYSSCVKVSHITERQRTADRWGNLTNPDAFSRQYRIKCCY